MRFFFFGHHGPQTDLLLRRLHQRHPDLKKVFEQAIATQAKYPYNRTREHQIKKLENIRAGGDGQYRLRIGRWRFRYDIDGHTVVLLYCGLRREETYRR